MFQTEEQRRKLGLENILFSMKNSLVSWGRDLKKAPIDTIGRIIPVFIIVLAVVTGFVSWITYIIHGGYVTQIQLLKSKGISGIEESITFFERQGLNGTIMQIGTCSLFVAEILLMLIGLFMKSATWKKVMMAVTLCLSSVIGLVTYCAYAIWDFWAYAFRNVKLTEEQTNAIIRSAQEAKGQFSLKIYAAIVCVLALIFVVLLLLEERRWMLRNSVIAMAINYLAVPLVLFLLQNIIPLIAGIILIAVLIFVAYIFFGGSSSEEKFLVTVRDGIVDNVHKISEK